jgi:hypothetical protein
MRIKPLNFVYATVYAGAILFLSELGSISEPKDWQNPACAGAPSGHVELGSAIAKTDAVNAYDHSATGRIAGASAATDSPVFVSNP